MAQRFTFGRNERLKSRKQIEELFSSGKSFTAYPLRVIYKFQPSDGNPRLQAGISAGRRQFRNAVDRNRAKRLVREAYRLQKNDLVQAVMEKDLCAGIFFIFAGNKEAGFTSVSAAMNKALKRLLQIIRE